MSALVQDAMRFALARHAGQRYGEMPYSDHLAQVVALQTVWLPAPSDEVLAAGWLHDVVEDTSATHQELRTRFGGVVASLVLACSARGGNRRDRADTLIRQLQRKPEALAVKLPDRIANVRCCWHDQDRRLFMYHREYRDFRNALRATSLEAVPGLGPLWGQIDELLGWNGPAFPTQEPAT